MVAGTGARLLLTRAGDRDWMPANGAGQLPQGEPPATTITSVSPVEITGSHLKLELSSACSQKIAFFMLVFFLAFHA